MAFSLNQSSAVCLPLVSDNTRLIWVPSNEINLQLDGAAELDKAFDQFPYLTEKRTAALALHCSLHPDQVKVWFMAQRLRYGISWDYDDISKVRRKFKSSQGQDELQNRKGEEVKEVREENEKCKRDGEKPGEIREEQSASEGRLMGQNVRVNERMERKMMQEQPVKKEKDSKVEEDKRNFQKKRKRTTTDKMGKKRTKQGEEGEIKSDEDEREGQKSSQAEKTLLTRHKKKPKAIKRLLSVQEWPAHRSFVVPDEALDTSLQLIRLSQTQASEVPPLTDSQTGLLNRVDTSTSNIHLIPVKSNSEGKTEEESTNHSGGDNDVGKLKELTEVNNNLVVDASPTVAQQQDSHVYDACKRPTRLRCKSKTQLSMLKAAFVHCQYPDSEDYKRLMMAIDIPHYTLVQWFGDMRYYIKKARPRWMNEEQYNLALANIRYQQQVNALIKLQPTLTADMSESCGEEKSVPVPPE